MTLTTDPYELQFEGLVTIHRAIDGVFQQVIDAAGAPLSVIVPAARGAAAFLTAHHVAESNILFPALRQYGRMRSTDVSALDAPARDAIDRAAQCWRQRGIPAALRLTGATDPNGTNEYNLALGERRAQAVKSYLVNLGIDASHISTMSMGEEEATGHDEGGWARDRHVRNTTQ